MADVFLCKTGAIDVASKRALKKAGVIVVEVHDPADCQFVRASSLVSGDDMLWAAMDALSREFGYGDKGEKQREQFAINVFRLVDAAHRPTRRPVTEGDEQ